MPRNRLLLALPAALLAGALAAPASAATFTVNSVIDAPDTAPGDGACASSAGACTLRAAVQEAGGLAGADAITLPSGNYQLGTGLGTLVITSSVTLNGENARTTTIRAAAGTRTIQVAATSTLRDLTITGGSLTGAGTLIGGGVRVTAGDLTLERVTVAGNQITAPQGAFGGGIGVESVDASVSVIDSTVRGNTASAQTGNNIGSAAGGGLYSVGPSYVKRSTFAANVALGGVQNYAQGGGAAMSGLSTIEQSTFSGNGVATIGDTTGFRQGGNLLIAENATISGTIVNAGTGAVGPDCYLKPSAKVSEPARNLESQLGGANECFGAGSLRGVNPKLGSLADNGGPTDTLRLAADSPAIDAAASCGSRTTDQRGNTLFGGAGCDLGAVEYAASRAVSLQASKSAALAGEDVTLIAKIASAGLDEATGETLTIEVPAGTAPHLSDPEPGRLHGRGTDHLCARHDRPRRECHGHRHRPGIGVHWNRHGAPQRARAGSAGLR